MIKIDSKKLLNFYEEIYYRKEISEKEVIKNYGTDVNNYLKIAGKIFNSPAPYRSDTQKYELNQIFILTKIDQLENKISREKQEKINTLMFFAIFIQALALSFQVVSSLYNTKNNILTGVILYLILFVLLIFLYELIEKGFKIRKELYI